MYHPLFHQTCTGSEADSLNCRCCCYGCLHSCDAHNSDHRGCCKPTRFFWWKAKQFDRKTRAYWQPFHTGCDEFCNRTLGIRLPFGVLFICLNVPLRKVTCDEELREYIPDWPSISN